MGKQVVVLEDHGKRAGLRWQCGDVRATDLDASSMRCRKACQQEKQRRFAGAARPQDGERVAIVHVQIELETRITVGERDVVHLDLTAPHACHHDVALRSLSPTVNIASANAVRMSAIPAASSVR